MRETTDWRKRVDAARAELLAAYAPGVGGGFDQATRAEQELRRLLSENRVSDRRFTDKFELDPSAVMSLAPKHPAIVEKRTLFPTTVVETNAEFSDRLLISGANNRKLGETVEKGKFKGYALYALTLEERATCPDDCDAKAYCYGNSMQLARRHKIDEAGRFYELLEAEIKELTSDGKGLLVRLHVLGDFPSIEYVAFWSDMLADYPMLACFGYTHRRTKNWGGDEIGNAIEAVKDMYPDRFRIRWSSPAPRPDGSVVINSVPNRPRVQEGLVCPAQTDATACCATCGLCWESAARNDTIAFIKHGPKSGEAAAEKAMLVAAGHAREMVENIGEPFDERPESMRQRMGIIKTVVAPAPPAMPSVETRAVKAIELPSRLIASEVLSSAPECRLVNPTTLRIEPKYQRDLTGKSIKLIRKIVSEWDWTKYKPPVCAETTLGLFIIDGQHTAIAAATHPKIAQIPVMVVQAAQVEKRADAFVAHNRDRLNMTPFQIFHAQVAAGDKTARGVLAATMRAGATIPRAQPDKYRAKPGDIVAVREVERIFREDGVESLEAVLRMTVASNAAPPPRVLIRALRLIWREPRFADLKSRGETAIAAAAASIPNIDMAARKEALDTMQSADRACAILIEAAAFNNRVAA